MKTQKILLILLSVGLLASTMLGLASAGSAASVSIAYVGQNPSDHSGEANLGSTVYIYWGGVISSTRGNTVDVIVINPDGTQLTVWNNLPPSASGTKSFVASSTGTYYVIINGYPTYHLYTTYVASASLFVLPEGALGTLLTLIAGFSAVGLFGIVKTKRAVKA